MRYIDGHPDITDDDERVCLQTIALSGAERGLSREGRSEVLSGSPSSLAMSFIFRYNEITVKNRDAEYAKRKFKKGVSHNG